MESKAVRGNTAGSTAHQQRGAECNMTSFVGILLGVCVEWNVTVVGHKDGLLGCATPHRQRATQQSCYEGLGLGAVNLQMLLKGSMRHIPGVLRNSIVRWHILHDRQRSSLVRTRPARPGGLV
eukprot:6201280-Pleurochrysis_carterae.AAC.10